MLNLKKGEESKRKVTIIYVEQLGRDQIKWFSNEIG
jgi:hypothetical protein